MRAQCENSMGFWDAHRKNFAQVSKNLARYRSENNIIWTIKIIM